MSTWTNRAIYLAFAGLLAACVPSEAGFSRSRSAPVLGGALSIGLPAGYCIDRAASREKDDAAVVIMGRCADSVSALPAVITISVGRPGTASVMAAGGQELASFFTSPIGKATLSRDGQASGVRVLEALMRGDAFLMHLKDRSTGDYWRAFLGRSGRLITVTATGSPKTPLSAQDSRTVLERALNALR